MESNIQNIVNSIFIIRSQEFYLRVSLQKKERKQFIMKSNKAVRVTKE